MRNGILQTQLTGQAPKLTESKQLMPSSGLFVELAELGLFGPALRTSIAKAGWQPERLE